MNDDERRAAILRNINPPMPKPAPRPRRKAAPGTYAAARAAFLEAYSRGLDHPDCTGRAVGAIMRLNPTEDASGALGWWREAVARYPVVPP